eukprot:COSAG05_NODE_1230_length_5443_cov_6.168600_5_plen_65_part_00
MVKPLIYRHLVKAICYRHFTKPRYSRHFGKSKHVYGRGDSAGSIYKSRSYQGLTTRGLSLRLIG